MDASDGGRFFFFVAGLSYCLCLRSVVDMCGSQDGREGKGVGGGSPAGPILHIFNSLVIGHQDCMRKMAGLPYQMALGSQPHTHRLFPRGSLHQKVRRVTET